MDFELVYIIVELLQLQKREFCCKTVATSLALLVHIFP